jgi:hypothetical protein
MSVDKSWLNDRKTYAVELAAFEQHKEKLINILRKAHLGGPKSEPFDEDSSWKALTIAAIWYFRRPLIRQRTVPPARRVERLRDFATALGRARNMAHKAMHDEVGADLFRGWWAETKANVFPVPVSPQVLNVIADEITEAVAMLATLEAVARRAAADVPTQVGSPRGTGILSMDDIFNLRAVYRRNTGLEPDTGAGPFGQLVKKFLTAVGRGDDTSKDYVFEALKYARRRAGKNPGK